MKHFLAMLIVSLIFAADLSLPQFHQLSKGTSFISTAEAQPARRSVRRTARRTSRRTTARHSAYYAPPRVYPALPGGCVSVVVNGVRVHRCGSLYYRPASGGYVVFTP